MFQRHTWRPYLFLLPAVVIYAMFILYPFGDTVRLSLYSWDGFGEEEWRGLDNYTDRMFNVGETADPESGFFRDTYFRRALRNNIVYWILTLITEVGFGLFLAALLVRVTRAASVYRLALSSPLMIALVASAVLWRQILGDRGLVNSIFADLGLDQLIQSWLGPEWVVYSIALISGWVYAGFFMLIFLAGLQRIPKELREAAQIDGASELSVFWKIELPLLRPVIAVCVLLASTGAFRVFDLFYVIVGTGRNRTSEVASTWLVKNAFTFRSFGYASAIAVVVVLIVLTIAALLNIWASRERELEY